MGDPSLASRNNATKVSILGISVDVTNLQSATAQILNWISERRKTYVCVSGVHGIMESRRIPGLKDIHNSAGMVTPDGMPLVYISRFLGHHRAGRVYGPDLMLSICRESVQHGYKHFFYGTTPATLKRLTTELCAKFPGLQVAGVHSPPFRALTDSERAEIVHDINAAAPDIVWVGLSTPKQELWMSENRADLLAPILIGVGAAFDFNSGGVRQAPAWMQEICLEWFFRLLIQPRRLWRRYLVNNPQFIVLLSMQLIGARRF